ncbi:MAG: rane protein [Actinomycetota bacterium]|nr:rane protein [Actinomycetota bacterium]
MPDEKPTKPKKPKTPKKPSRFAPVIARVKRLFLVRVVLYYSNAQGPLLASGLAYQAIFAVFAALWVGFSIVGIIVAGNHQLQQPLVDALSSAVPGLIKDSSGNGAIDPQMLLDAGVFTWTGAIALVGVLVTALSWLASARTAIRIIFELPQLTTNFLLLKLKDLGVGVGFGLALIVSTALSAGGTAATGVLLNLSGIGSDSVAAAVIGRIVTIGVAFLLDAIVLGVFFRVLSGVPLSWRRLRGGALVGALVLGALKFLGGSLLGVSKSNPLLASFAVILGLLIFFNFVCQIILVSASWTAVGMKDRGLPIDPVAEAARIEQERKDVEAAQAKQPRGLARLFRRRKPRDAKSKVGADK